MPAAVRVAVLVNPNNPQCRNSSAETCRGGPYAGAADQVLNASTEREIECGLRTLSERAARRALRRQRSLLYQPARPIAALAARHAVPTIYGSREYRRRRRADELWSNIADAYRQVGIYVGRILKGEKPADLPVVAVDQVRVGHQPQDRQALGLTVPPSLLARADEVIE